MVAAEKGLQGADEVAGGSALGASDRCGELLLEGQDDGDGALGDSGALVGEAELDSAEVGRVPGPLDQPGLLEGAGELGDEMGSRPVQSASSRWLGWAPLREKP